MEDTFILFKDIHKIFQMGESAVHALAGVDLSIPTNTFCLVMGPSGSGKSTLLHILGGLDRPTSGSLVVNGKKVETLDENQLAVYRRQTVGFIFQSFNLIASMSALENVAFPLRFSRVPARQRKARALELLIQVGLEDRKDHKPTELSGGQQQRVAIARALVNNPQIILADEPTGNLDTASGDSILQILRELHQRGTTIVMVSHDARTMGYANKVVHILDGKIQLLEGLSTLPGVLIQ